MRKSNYPSNPNWERIEAVMKHYQFPSVSAFARHLGLNRAENLQQIKRGNNGISLKLAETIHASFPQISKAWLLTGENSMFVKPPGLHFSQFE